MLIKELIEILQKHDPDIPVRIRYQSRDKNGKIQDLFFGSIVDTEQIINTFYITGEANE